MITVNVPHDGEGTHTLVVALEIPDDLLHDPTAYPRIVARVTALTRRALAELPIDEPIRHHPVTVTVHPPEPDVRFIPVPVEPRLRT